MYAATIQIKKLFNNNSNNKKSNQSNKSDIKNLKVNFMDSIINFSSALFGSIIGGLIAIYAAIAAVRRTEYYRLRTLLITAFQDIVLNLQKTTDHPASSVENSRIDALVADILTVMPCRKRSGLKHAWEEYRHDKNIKIHNMEPREYTQKSLSEARKIITERILNLISKI